MNDIPLYQPPKIMIEIAVSYPQLFFFIVFTQFNATLLFALVHVLLNTSNSRSEYCVSANRSNSVSGFFGFPISLSLSAKAVQFEYVIQIPNNRFG